MARKVVDITIRIKDGVSKGLGKMRKGFASTIASMKRFALVGAAMAGAVAVAVGKMVKVFMVQEDAQNALAASLDNAGLAGKKILPVFQAYASAIQRVTKYGDEGILAAMAYGKNLGISASQLRDATTAAAGLAAKYGIDLKTAMMLVGRASQGQTTMLTRYGITLDETLTPQEKFNQLLIIGADAFKLAEAETDTLSGRTGQLKGALFDVQEELIATMAGTNGFKEGIKNLTTEILDMINRGDIAMWAEETKANFEAVGKVVAPIGKAIAAISKAAARGARSTGAFFGGAVGSFESGTGFVNSIKAGADAAVNSEIKLENTRDDFHKKHKARKEEELRLAEKELKAAEALTKATVDASVSGALATPGGSITKAVKQGTRRAPSYTRQPDDDPSNGSILGTFGGALIGPRRVWADPDPIPEQAMLGGLSQSLSEGIGGAGDSVDMGEELKKTNELLLVQNELLDQRLGGVKGD